MNKLRLENKINQTLNSLGYYYLIFGALSLIIIFIGIIRNLDNLNFLSIVFTSFPLILAIISIVCATKFIKHKLDLLDTFKLVMYLQVIVFYLGDFLYFVSVGVSSVLSLNILNGFYFNINFNFLPSLSLGFANQQNISVGINLIAIITLYLIHRLENDIRTLKNLQIQNE